MLVFVFAFLAATAVFLFIFGESNAFRGTFVAKLHALLAENVPRFLYYAIEFVVGSAFMARAKVWSDKLFYTRHPLIQIFYLVLVTGCIALFLAFGWRRIPNTFVSPIHQLLFPLVWVFTYVVFFTACWSDPGVVNAKNADIANKLFDHDYLIFSPKICSTCLIDKPARSKHCSLCKVCVARADHHCGWINNCVGHSNYRFFLLFLTATWVLSFYMAYIVARIIQSEVYAKGFHRLMVMDQKTNKPRLITGMECFMYVSAVESVLFALGGFALLAGVVVFAFMVYQLYLVSTGRTANESFKWEDLDFEIKHKIVTEISVNVLEYNRNYGKQPGLAKIVLDPPSEVASNIKSGEVKKSNTRKRKGKASPNSTEKTEPDDESVPFTDINQVRNIYDRGAFRNIWDVLFPFPING